MYPFVDHVIPEPPIYELKNVERTTYCFLIHRASGRLPMTVRQCQLDSRAAPAFKWLKQNSKSKLEIIIKPPYIRVSMDDRDAVLFKTFWM